MISLPTVEDTEALGERLAAFVQAGDLIILDGPLGAGKTAFTRGLGRGLGVTGVTSPTFVISRLHRGGRLPLVHVDAYRLATLDDLESIDLDASLEESVTVVEWGTGLVEMLSPDYLVVRLARAIDSETREAILEPHGALWNSRLPLDEHDW